MVDYSTAQGRYYVVNRPTASPGCCAICGYAGGDRTYLDPRMDFEFYGSVFFCDECVASMASMLGYATPEQVKAMETRLEDSERELIRLRAVATTFEDFRVAFSSIDTGSNSPSRGSGSSDLADSPAVTAVKDDAGTVKDGAGTSGSTAKSAVVQGRNDLRDSDSSAESSLSL